MCEVKAVLICLYSTANRSTKRIYQPIEIPAKSKKENTLPSTTAFVKSFAGGYTWFKLSED